MQLNPHYSSNLECIREKLIDVLCHNPSPVNPDMIFSLSDAELMSETRRQEATDEPLNGHLWPIYTEFCLSAFL